MTAKRSKKADKKTGEDPLTPSSLMRDPIEEFRLRRPAPGPGSRPAEKRERTGEEVAPEALLPDFLLEEQSTVPDQVNTRPDSDLSQTLEAPESACEPETAPTPPKKAAPEPPTQAPEAQRAAPQPAQASPPAPEASQPPAPEPQSETPPAPSDSAQPEAAPAPEEAAQSDDLSTPAMLRLMRLELDRAQKHRYPISCLVIGLDGYDGEEDAELRKALMPAIFKELKVACVKNDVRGLGTWSPAFQMAIFPHVEPDAATELAKSLMERVRCLRLRMGDETRLATISVGIAHNMRQGGLAFEDLLDDAEAGLRLAGTKGGDRCITFRQVEDDVDDLREELLGKAQELRAQQKSYFEEKASVEDKWGRELLEKVMSVFQSEDEVTETSMRLEQRVLEMVGREVDALRENSNLRALAESQHQIEMLERRLAKLTTSLEQTEAELKRVASMKVVGDDGIASIYRSVQGLSDDDANSEAKREMMKDIFAANLDFRKKKLQQQKKKSA